MTTFDYTKTEQEKKMIKAKKDKIKYMKLMFSRWILQNGDISNNINSYLIHWQPKKLIDITATKYRGIKNKFRQFLNYNDGFGLYQIRIPITDLFETNKKVLKLWERANNKTKNNNGSKSQMKNTKDWDDIKDAVEYIVEKHKAIRKLDGSYVFEIDYGYYNSVDDDCIHSLTDWCEEFSGYGNWSNTKINKLKNIVKKNNCVGESGVQYNIYKKGYYYLWENRNTIQLEKELNVDVYMLIQEMELGDIFKHPNNFYKRCYDLTKYHSKYCNLIRERSRSRNWRSSTYCFGKNVKDMVLDVICKKRFNGDCNTTTNNNIIETFQDLRKMFDGKMKIEMCDTYRKNVIKFRKNKNKSWIEDKKINETRAENVYIL